MLDAMAPATQARVASLARAILDQHGAKRGLEPDDRLVDAGLTSVDMVNLMLSLETEFDVMIPPGDITPQNFRSIASITAMMERVLVG